MNTGIILVASGIVLSVLELLTGVTITFSPLTYFARGVRKATYLHEPVRTDLLVLVGVAVVFFVLGAYAVPQGE